MKPTVGIAQTLNDLPGPKGLPLLGNLLQLDRTQLHTVLEQWVTTYGPLYRFNIATKPVVVIADPALVQEVLRQRPDTYRRLGTFEPVLTEMGINGVFAAEGGQWRKHRRVAMQALNAQHLRHFSPTLTRITARLKTRWERAAATGHPIKVQKDLMCYTVDVTTHLAFGYDLNSLEDSGDVLQHHLEKVLPMVNHRSTAPFPYWHFVKLPADRALDQALAAMHETIAGIVSQSRVRLAQNSALSARPTNFLEAMLVTQEAQSGAFSDDEIVGNLLTMLLAGEDTTANTIAWMMHFMTEHPEIQHRMQQEADTVLGNAPLLQQFQDYERLTYLNAIAQETLRLKPAAPVLFHETLRDGELGGVQIPAGTALFLLLRSSWMQESTFVNVTQFQPERWLTSVDTPQSGHDPSTFIPFGSGPRLCPGYTLALLEIKAVAAMLCHNFAIVKTDPTQPVDERFAFTMTPTNLLVNFSRRDNAVKSAVVE